MAPVILERALLFLAAFGHHRADLAGGGKQRRSLGADDLEITFLARLDPALRGKLSHLALCNYCAGMAEDAKHLEAAVFGHQLERAAEQRSGERRVGKACVITVRSRR